MYEVIADLEACHKSLVSRGTNKLSSTAGLTGADETGAESAPCVHGVKQPADNLALDAWLKAELPAAPTLLRNRPAKRLQLTKQQRRYAAIAATLALVVLVVLGVVISVQTPRGTIVVRVSQPDAQVFVDDGKVRLKAPGEKSVEIEVVEGEHTLKVTKGGFETYTEAFRIKSRDHQVFDVKLVPLAEGKGARGRPSRGERDDA
jgi:hypothetical protein